MALSFPGSKRDRVEPIAAVLASTLGEDRVLYDRYHEAEFARPNLDVYLPQLYRTQSDLIVVFLCPQYAERRWCGLELRHIRQLLGTPEEARIMFLSFGDPGDLTATGILAGDGYVDIERRSPAEAAALILERLGQEIPRKERPPPPDPRPPKLRLQRPAGMLTLAAGLGITAAAWGMAAWRAHVCAGLSRLGLHVLACETSLEAERIAALHPAAHFAAPPALPAEDGPRSETWLMENKSRRPVGVLFGKLRAAGSGTREADSWEKLTIPAEKVTEWSTGEEPAGRSGVWVVAVYDPADPWTLLAPLRPLRLLFRTAAEQEGHADVSALSLSIQEGGGSSPLDIHQDPELRITP